MHRINPYSTLFARKSTHNFPKSSKSSTRSFSAHVRNILDFASKDLKITQLSDWYNVTTQVYKNLLRYQFEKDFNESPFQLLTTVYPEHKWLPWMFNRCPKHFWDDINNQRQYMEWAGNELKIKDMSDWYNISHEDLIKIRGHSLLKKYNYSVSKLLSVVYPNYEWLPWKFAQCPQGYWSDTANQKKFIEWAGKQLNIKVKSDWYNVYRQDLIKLGGRHLFAFNNSSLPQVLSVVYPEYNWLLSKFRSTTKGLASNSKEFIEYFAKELNIKEFSDWYKVKPEQFIDLGGGLLLIKNNTLCNLLSFLYPDYKWNKSLLSNTDIWTDEHLSSYFVEWLKKQSSHQIEQVRQLVNESQKTGTLLSQLKSLPQFKFIGSFPKKTQYMLKECISKMFVSSLLLEEYKHPDISNLELDYFLPQHKLAFEYQGQQHYRNNVVFHQKESMDVSQKRDKQKSELCKELGITLIEVPFWWDKKYSSLAVTVYNARPDLFQVEPQGDPIPWKPIESTSTKKTSKEFLMTATEFDLEKIDPKGWFMTEKYDGMRLYWNGTQFITRQGRKIQVPESITKQLPTVELDGELWTQYGLHQEAVSLGRSTDESRWNKSIYWIFDSPQLERKPLEERIEFLRQLQLPSFAKVVEFVKCEGKQHLKEFNEAILKKGGEGVMLREPNSLYKSGRSTSLRKYKPFLDTEVKVVKNQYPHGFICEQLNGKNVFVNIANEVMEEAKKIKEGDVVTVKHSGMNVHGTLLYPQFYRERVDVKWSDLNKTV